MRVNTSFIPSVLLALSFGGAACVVNMGSGSQAQPQRSAAQPPPPAPAPAAQAKPQAAKPQAAKPAPTTTPLAANPSIARLPIVKVAPGGSPMIEVDGKPVPTISKPVPFGEGKESPGSMLGLVYFLPEDTQKLPDFSSLIPTAALYAKQLDISPRSFDQGFPGVDGRHEWFAIKYTGQFSVKAAGEYEFRLVSDDGATLKIDNVLIVDNDGVHPPSEKRGKVRLLAGSHSIEVKYFQGPRYDVALQLFVTPPNGKEQLWSASL